MTLLYKHTVCTVKLRKKINSYISVVELTSQVELPAMPQLSVIWTQESGNGSALWV